MVVYLSQYIEEYQVWYSMVVLGKVLLSDSVEVSVPEKGQV